MKKKENQIKKVCSFYVNDWHLTTMMLPYMNRRIRENVTIETMLQNGIEDKVSELIGKMNLSKDSSSKILGINWTSNTVLKYSEIKSMIEEAMREEEIDILVNGTTDYIEIINQSIKKVLEETKIKGKQINIINAYEVTQFENINEVLEKHNAILNTSGIQEISDVFEGYSKQEKTAQM